MKTAQYPHDELLRAGTYRVHNMRNGVRVVMLCCTQGHVGGLSLRGRDAYTIAEDGSVSPEFRCAHRFCTVKQPITLKEWATYRDIERK